MSIVEIKNESLKVKISSFGAEIHSVVKDGKERVWQGDPDGWKDHQPVLFPVCGSLSEKKYIYDGVEYPMPSHGFARKSEFEVFSLSENQAVFLLKSDEKTKVFYPFDFEFYVSYTLDKNSIKTVYRAVNKGKNKMFCAVGAHDSFKFSQDLDDGHSLRFEKNERFLSEIVLNGGILSRECDDFGAGEILELKHSMFAHDTVVLKNVNSRSVEILENGEVIAKTVFDSPHILVWSSPKYSPYVCVEPWSKYPDYAGASEKIEDKNELQWLNENEEFSSEHTVFYY